MDQVSWKGHDSTFGDGDVFVFVVPTTLPGKAAAYRMREKRSACSELAS